MSRAVSPVSGRPYGLTLVCRAWRVSRATVYRQRATPRLEPPRRAGPVGLMSDTALLDAIRGVLAGSPFTAKGIARSARGYASAACGLPGGGCRG